MTRVHWLLIGALAACQAPPPPKSREPSVDVGVGVVPAVVPEDPVAVTVNRRVVRRSEVERLRKQQPTAAPRVLLSQLVAEALLLQEAEATGYAARHSESRGPELARRYLESARSERVVCGNLTERDFTTMYSMMRPSFEHGTLIDVTELRLLCGEGPDPATELTCRRRIDTVAEESLRAVADTVHTAADVEDLARLTAPEGARLVHFTFEVDHNGRSSLRAAASSLLASLAVGEARVHDDERGVRLSLVTARRPPLQRTLDAPGVRDEVRAALCPRVLEAERRRYVDALRASATVDLTPGVLPAGWTLE